MEKIRQNKKWIDIRDVRKMKHDVKTKEKKNTESQVGKTRQE